MVRDGDAADRDNDFRNGLRHPNAGNVQQDFNDEDNIETEADILPCYSYQPNGTADANLNPALVQNIRTNDYFKGLCAPRRHPRAPPPHAQSSHPPLSSPTHPHPPPAPIALRPPSAQAAASSGPFAPALRRRAPYACPRRNVAHRRAGRSSAPSTLFLTRSTTAAPRFAFGWRARDAP